MVVKNVSPGGALLRTSRLFSLPAPIPSPPGDLSASTRFHSETATLAFPTHQVITTTESSRKRGDWGLKRPLPLKSTTKSSTPMLRVKHVDSIEQVTDYSSASDHGLSLRKWQELRMPLTVPPGDDALSVPQRNAYRMGLSSKSVFDEDGDFTAMDPGKEQAAESKRWKFRGPWLAGMTEGDFKRWVAKRVRPQRSAFRAFLRKSLAAQKTARALAAAQDKGEIPIPGEGDGAATATAQAVEPHSITNAELDEYVRELRVDRPTLYAMVGRFLDLAPLQPPSHADMASLGTLNYSIRSSGNPYAITGPPVTHPSAGLSYLRTQAYLDNHPLYGPQAAHPPVQARVVVPRPTLQGGTAARLGVGGFIADSPAGEGRSNSRNGPQVPGLDRFDPRILGGAKLWVEPANAMIDSRGRVVLTVKDAHPEAELVARELLGEEKVFGRPRPREEPIRGLEEFKVRRPLRSVMGSSETYGL